MANGLDSILRYLREENNKKQYEVSNYLNISHQAYSNYESGIRTPDITTLIRLAYYYNVDILLLLAPMIPKELADEFASTHTQNDAFNMYQGLTGAEFKLLHQFRKLSQTDQDDILLFTQIKSHRDEQ